MYSQYASDLLMEIERYNLSQEGQLNSFFEAFWVG
jgi:hypothetical protein